MKFQVLSGNHSEGAKTYTKNQVVESERPLDKIFKNKFRCLDAPPEAPPLVDTTPAEEPLPPKPAIKRVSRAVAPPQDPAPAPAPTPEPEAPNTTSESVPVAKLRAIHNGGGRWYVADADGTRLNKEPLKRADASAAVERGSL